MTIPNKYDVGDQVRLYTPTVFTDIDDTPFDPAEVRFRYIDPSGNETTVSTEDVGNNIQNPATGSYYLDIEVDEEGDWSYRVEGWTLDATPVRVGASETRFNVRDSVFYPEAT